MMDLEFQIDTGTENEGSQHVTVPLFLKKLWKMVNDPNAQDIIAWNSTGDGFVIHDQLQFMLKLLPKYFKHNNLASFVRQLNFYDFHKVANIDRDEMQFTHSYFLKDLPQTLAFIKRKCPTKPKIEKDPSLMGILHNIKEMKTKHEVIKKEFKRLQQENVALWTEMNSLRMKHSKQTKVINKLIHFLITYMQSQHSVTKRSSGNKTSQNKRLKTGPKILELDYHKTPVELWSEFDNSSDQHGGQEEAASNEYTVTEPESNTDLDAIICTNEKNVNTLTASSSHLTPQVNIDPKITATTSKSSTSSKNSGQIDIPDNHKENLGFYIDNTQVELNSIQDMLNNLSQSDIASFYELVNENSNFMEDDEYGSIGIESSQTDDLQKQLPEVSLPLESIASLPPLDNEVALLSKDTGSHEAVTADNDNGIYYFE